MLQWERRDRRCIGSGMSKCVFGKVVLWGCGHALESETSVNKGSVARRES